MTGRWPVEEHRGSPRIETAGALRAHLSLEAEVVTISARGMMIRLGVAPDVGSRLPFSLAIDGATLDVQGVVRNIERHGNDGPMAFGVGVEFVGLSHDQMLVLEAFVNRKLGV
jgi:PilZ domain